MWLLILVIIGDNTNTILINTAKILIYLMNLVTIANNPSVATYLGDQH